MVKASLIQAPEALKRLLPLAIGGVFVWLLWTKSQDLDWHAVQSAFDAIPRWRWGAAALATLISFWAVAQYDVIAHRHFQTGISSLAARHAGAAAIAVGQTTGFGPVVGGAIRWRMMPSLGHKRIAQVTGLVTLGFLTAWAVLTFSIALPVLLAQAWLSLLLYPLCAAGLGWVSLRYPRQRLLGMTLVLPSVRAMGQMTCLAACDLLFAGLALHLLLPPEIAPSLPVLVAAFAVALGAGMIGGTPGGVGPFELALLALVPAPDVVPLAAGLIAFRLIYYVLPCALALAYAALSPTAAPRPIAQNAPPQSASWAEFEITQQAPCQPLVQGGASACLLDTPQSLTLFRAPIGGSVSTLLPALKKTAFLQNKLPCLYKIGARDAVQVRAAGWALFPAADEAIITPNSYSDAGPERRQLRRFLRKAEKANVSFAVLDHPDWPALQQIHQAWETDHGAERGLTMGRFCPLYLEDKPLFGAFHEGKLIAFISAVCAPTQISLDLMRHKSDIPTGTMHGLIHFMILWAKEAKLDEVSLAAVPHRRISRWQRGASGLTRFKASFAPSWRRLYLAGPSPWALVLSAVDLWQEVHRPAPIPYSTSEKWQVDALLHGETCSDSAFSEKPAPDLRKSA